MTQNETLSVGDNAHSPRGGGHINNPTTNIHGKNLIIIRFKAFIYIINLGMIFHREISLFIVLGENGNARNQNNLLLRDLVACTLVRKVFFPMLSTEK